MSDFFWLAVIIVGSLVLSVLFYILLRWLTKRENKRWSEGEES